MEAGDTYEEPIENARARRKGWEEFDMREAVKGKRRNLGWERRLGRLAMKEKERERVEAVGKREFVE